jgi:signal recognition particle subunit SRP54
MHRNMADMMKAMGQGKRGPMAALGNMMGFGGGGGMPSPEQMKELAEKMPGGLPQNMPGLPKDFPGVASPGLPGLGKPTLPGLGGFPGLGKKK